MKKLYIVYPRNGYEGQAYLVCAFNPDQAKETHPELRVFALHARCIGAANSYVAKGVYAEVNNYR